MAEAEFTAMSTPINYTSGHTSGTDAHYILSTTPPIATSKLHSQASKLATDDLKSISTPNITAEGTHQRDDTKVQLRADKRLHPVEYRQSLPTSTDKYVRVISDGSPPTSPDLKFTRVAKKKWTNMRNLSDDLSASASTGNVINEGRGGKSMGPTTGSLRSFQSDESISFEKSSFLQKPTIPSPLAAMSTSTPTQISNGPRKSDGFSKKISPIIVAKLKEGDKQRRLSPANARAVVPAGDGLHASADNLPQTQFLRVNRPLKRGQLDIVRGFTERAKQSPMSSFILDSNLLDVSLLMQTQCKCEV